KGIRETIVSRPDRFLPYNNGICATAASVVTKAATDGLAYIDAVQDFQVVNGGQTTASLASCARRDGSDLSQIFVQMKLTIVPQEKLDEVVPLISQYANTQNKVQEADFKANHPYHIALEKLSRQIWTRPTDTTPRGTRWFYERSRGQYAVEKLRFAEAGKRRFTLENPPSQKFSKTDLAKYLMSWDQYPQDVSLGAQKNFMEFMSLLGRENRPMPDEPEFKRIASLAMLFKRAETLYGEMGFTGYRAQVVAYTLAMLSYRVKKHLDWDEFWQAGAVPETMIEMMRPLMLTARNIILNSPSQQNITEWCKKDACWMAVLQANTEEISDLPVIPPPSAVPLGEADKH
ncbi:AIPR family protein, partial [Dolichospermum sp. ST_sed3]|nr:AIPR family protein [Dolichospermum sp. ST_sed3]